FWTYSPLVPPCAVAFGDNSTTSAVRIGTVVLFSTISRNQYEIILTNVLLILEFWISVRIQFLWAVQRCWRMAADLASTYVLCPCPSSVQYVLEVQSRAVSCPKTFLSHIT
ncbi:hypothetical protein PAXRUDRAFT_165782, partial [Paxillus rubicundulus Ve08.2h10]